VDVEIERHGTHAVPTAEGTPLGWAGEVIRFSTRDVEYRFDLDDATPGEATFAWINQNGCGTFVDLTAPRQPICGVFPRGSPLLRQAVRWLTECRGVQFVLVWDCRSEQYSRLPVGDLG
jgi:hypothetical protein